MSPVMSAEGEKINWVNYKTGEKDLSFRMSADNKTASIAITLAHKDLGIQQLYFEQLAELRKILESALGEEWVWVLHYSDETGRITSMVYTEIEDVSIYRKADWPELISFFKQRMIALDEFWSQVKYSFETLR